MEAAWGVYKDVVTVVPSPFGLVRLVEESRSWLRWIYFGLERVLVTSAGHAHCLTSSP